MVARKKKAVAKRGGTGIVNLRKKLGEISKLQEERLKGGEGGNWISMQDGEFVHGDEILGQPMPVVVLDDRFVHAYYPEAYDEDKPQSPICYAIAKEEEDLAPHEECEEPQAEKCEDCEFNEYGTDARGKGKACRNVIRIAVTPAGKISSENEVALMNVPPTSMKAYRGHVRKNNASTGLPSMGYITELSTAPLGKGKIGHKLVPSFVEELSDDELETVFGLYEGCQEDIEVTFMKQEEVEERAASRRPARSKKRVSKKAPARKKTTARRTAKKKTAKRKY